MHEILKDDYIDYIDDYIDLFVLTHWGCVFFAQTHQYKLEN